MPEICRFYGIVIKMFFQDHSPPHFHAEYNEFEALFNINTLEIIQGDLPPKAKSLVIEWATKHTKELLDNWVKANKPEQLIKIEPLQ